MLKMCHDVLWWTTNPIPRSVIVKVDQRPSKVEPGDLKFDWDSYKYNLSEPGSGFWFLLLILQTNTEESEYTWKLGKRLISLAKTCGVVSTRQIKTKWSASKKYRKVKETIKPVCGRQKAIRYLAITS